MKYSNIFNCVLFNVFVSNVDILIYLVEDTSLKTDTMMCNKHNLSLSQNLSFLQDQKQQNEI